jgi:putative SOS response-associated peptidase YedK
LSKAGTLPAFFCSAKKWRFGSAFAGLWELWRKADGNRLASCTVLTCGANELMAPIHNRMAVILQPGDESKWLDVGHASCEQLQPISTSYQRI